MGASDVFDSDHSDHSGANAAVPHNSALVGAAGQEFITESLSEGDPRTGIHVIQSRAALPGPDCKPLLGLLDQLGCKRCGGALRCCHCRS